MWCNGLSLEDWQERVATEDDYMCLHGFCNQWVVDNYQDGDVVLVITALDEDQDFDHLVHCCLIRNGLYLDVRGATPNFESVVEGFDDYDCYEDYSEVYTFDTLDDFLLDMKDIGVM